MTTPTKTWSKNWPTIPGAYWFYGKRFRTGEPRLFFARANTNATGDITVVCEGVFLYRAEGAEGVWMPIELPALP